MKTLTELRASIRCPVLNPTRGDVAIMDAVAHYDYLGGIGNDRLARRVAAEALAHDIGLGYIHAAELLADALARRAASNPNQPNLE